MINLNKMTVEEYFEKWWTPKELPKNGFNKTAMLDFAETYHKAALRQPPVSGRSEQLFCECERNNPYTGVKFDFDLRCFTCNRIIEQNNCH